MIGNIVAGQIGVTAAAAPTPVSGYKLWLDASDTATITASGGLVSQWSDKSGFGSNFTQSTGANQPTTGTRTLNSLNTIDFDGTNDSLTCSSSTTLFNYLHSSTGGTTFFVGLLDNVASSKVMWYNNGGSSSQTGVYQDLSASNKNFTQITKGISGSPVAVSTDNITVSNSVGFMITNKWDGGNGTAADRALLSLNSGAFSGNNSNSNSPVSSNASSDMLLAAGSYNGTIAEIIFYSGILSAGDITQVQSYLTTKWGL
jgi:hypothetical protein